MANFTSVTMFEENFTQPGKEVGLLLGLFDFFRLVSIALALCAIVKYPVETLLRFCQDVLSCRIFYEPTYILYVMDRILKILRIRKNTSRNITLNEIESGHGNASSQGCGRGNGNIFIIPQETEVIYCRETTV